MRGYKSTQHDVVYWRVYAKCISVRREMEDEAKKQRARMRDVFVNLYYDVRS